MNTMELNHAVNKQLPLGATTYSPCPDCGELSRGGAACLSCLPKYYDGGADRAKVFIDAKKNAHAVLVMLMEIEERKYP